MRNPAQPSLRALYNRSALFLSASRSEGWGLTGAEAMLSGAAFVGTDIGGHREYARAEETALLAPPGDPAALAAEIVRLARDPRSRVELARRGRAAIEAFTWDRAVLAFERIVLAPGGAAP